MQQIPIHVGALMHSSFSMWIVMNHKFIDLLVIKGQRFSLMKFQEFCTNAKWPMTAIWKQWILSDNLVTEKKKLNLWWLHKLRKVFYSFGFVLSLKILFFTKKLIHTNKLLIRAVVVTWDKTRLHYAVNYVNCFKRSFL